jgi:hypothetical protein
MKTTNFRTVEELNLDVNAPSVTPTKVHNDKIVRALKKLSVTDPDETLIVKIVSAFVALGINPQAKSSSWLARRLRNHLQAFGLVAAAPAPVVEQKATEMLVQEAAQGGVEEPATGLTAGDQNEVENEPAAMETAKVRGKKAGKKE